jgi:hypothetical protein
MCNSQLLTMVMKNKIRTYRSTRYNDEQLAETTMPTTTGYEKRPSFSKAYKNKYSRV